MSKGQKRDLDLNNLAHLARRVGRKREGLEAKIKGKGGRGIGDSVTD